MTRISKRNAAKIRNGIRWGHTLNAARKVNVNLFARMFSIAASELERGSLAERAMTRTALPWMADSRGRAKHERARRRAHEERMRKLGMRNV